PSPEEHVEEVEGGVEGELPEVGHLLAAVAVRIVALTLLRVTQDGVGLAHLLELLLGSLVTLVAVGVKLHGELAVRAFQLLGFGVALDTEDLVVVALDRGHQTSGPAVALRPRRGCTTRTSAGRRRRSRRR